MLETIERNPRRFVNDGLPYRIIHYRFDSHHCTGCTSWDLMGQFATADEAFKAIGQSFLASTCELQRSEIVCYMVRKIVEGSIFRMPSLDGSTDDEVPIPNWMKALYSRSWKESMKMGAGVIPA